MIPRYTVAVALGAPVALGLLFVMQALIAIGPGAETARRGPRIVDLVRLERDDAVRTKTPRPEKLPEPPRRPPPPSTPGPEDGGGRVVIAVPRPPGGADRVSPRALGAVESGDYLPIVKVAPVYPMRARTLGLGGYAVVEYTVTRAGTTRDLRVLESTNGVFERPCLEAAAKFKYRPRVVDGSPVEVTGVRNRCTFEIGE